MNNITYIIPIIHHQHATITNYNDILLCLKRTLNNLIMKKGVHIIVVLNKLPIWYELYKHHVDFHFII